MQKLTAIKLLHTFVWIIIAAAILYLGYCIISARITTLTWVAVAITSIESAVMVANRLTCPMSRLAAKHTDSRAPNFDIYLPHWVAKYNKRILTPIMVMGWIWVLWRVFLNR